jgi:hypothetical protein
MPDPFVTDPALVYLRDPGNKPGTHVITIGIGTYDHLKGGSGALTRHHLEMDQLTSPPASARAVATWFIDHFDCDEAPLASVSLVLSEPQPATFQADGKLRTVPRGTFVEVKAALDAWMERASVDTKSRLVFYFCGHGLAAGAENLYLLRDYGSDRNDPMTGALNYTRFKLGLASRKPSTQFLLFDACRSSPAFAKWNEDGGQRVFGVDLELRLGVAEPMLQCPLFSTELDSKARGRPNEPTFCASAFIQAMSGASAQKENGQWYVTTHRMEDALTLLQNRALAKLGVGGIIKQDATSNGFNKFRLRKFQDRKEPEIPVFLRLNGQAQVADMRISATRTGGAPQQPRPLQGLEIVLTPGEYEFRAEQADGTLIARTTEIVFPISVDVPL